MTQTNARRNALQLGLKAAGALATVSAFPGLLASAQAQSAWPTKPIRLLVPFAPGGSSEIVARSAANELGKTLGRPVLVDNKPGAAGNIAMQECATSSDGHTLILGHIGTFAVNPFIFDKLPFDTNRDFRPISLLAKVPSLYVVNSDVPAKNLKEFIALAKAKPGQLNYGSAGNLAFERLRGDTAQPVGDTPAQYAAFIRAEQVRWKQAVALAKIRANEAGMRRGISPSPSGRRQG